ncbi:MAG: EscU/YscU/HrcU family type III secretion system export apparatus switch protein, partial [Caldimonas sp.]
MADTSAQDKNLPASQRRLDKARDDGQVARSRDLGHFAAIAAGSALVATGAPHAAAVLKEAVASSLRFDRAQALGAGAMSQRLGDLTATWAWAALPFGAAMIVVAIAGGFAMSGWTWTLKPLGPKFQFLNPFAGIGRVFSKQQLVDTVKGSILALVLGTIGALWLKSHVMEFAGILALPLPAAISAASSVMVGGLVLLLIALAL